MVLNALIAAIFAFVYIASNIYDPRHREETNLAIHRHYEEDECEVDNIVLEVRCRRGWTH